MSEIPRDRRIDSTLAFVRNPYHFISETCERYNTDIFVARLLGQKTILMKGAALAELFYDADRFKREGAMPARVVKTLLGQGGVQALDDEKHRHRKHLFMSLMSDKNVQRLVDITHDHWQLYADKWANMEEVVLYDEMREVLCKAVCTWAGIPLQASEIPQRTRELTALFADAGSIGLKHWWSRLARKLANRWAKAHIERIRSQQQTDTTQDAAHVIAFHRDTNGNLLDANVAAVELLNILRPTVAVAVFITFAAHALHQHPLVRQQVILNDGSYTARFVQEVRRMYPFFPSVAARVRKDFVYDDYTFPQGTRVILDLYGTNHDSRTWKAPEKFYPDRFLEWDKSLFNFIPQGGGNPEVTHRCPGEKPTIELMKAATTFLANAISYSVPEQDLQIDYSKLPALPGSGFIITNVEVKSVEQV